MKIYVLGSSGMLGRYVTKYLQSNYEVVVVGREKLDASSVDKTKLISILRDINIEKGDVVINCIGTIKSMVDEVGDLNTIIVNSVFPRVLASVKDEFGIHIIHPTTDCVFSGLRGAYGEDDVYDVHDIYGMSKALGENSTLTTIRTSIIGEEVGHSRSLVEWVKSNKDKEVFGFTNHMWNGVTCLQFAKICEHIISKNLFWNGTRHLFSNSLSKKDLVELISKVYELNISVVPKETPIQCDRTLTTKYVEFLQEFAIPSLEVQIKEMKEFSQTLHA